MWKGEQHFYFGSCGIVFGVAVLAALLFPLFARVREENRIATCEAHLMHWGCLLSLHADRHGGLYPTVADIHRMEKRTVRFTCEVGDRPLEYHRPPKGARPDFVVLRCRGHNGVVLELRLDGKVYREVEPRR